MKSPLLVCLLATSAMAVTPAFAANTMAATPAPAANATTTTPAPAVKKLATTPAPTPAAKQMAAISAPAAKKTVKTPSLNTNIAMLQVKQNSTFGKYLVDGNGRALYAFSADKPAREDAVAKSACTGACAVVWPPATIKNMPTSSGKAIESSEMSTVARADGIKQLTYDGQPLYLFAHDKNGAAPKGQGIQHFGGTWHLVTPGGALDQKGIG